jgi:hypothetical protein
MHPSVMFFIRLHSSLLEGLVWKLLETNAKTRQGAAALVLLLAMIVSVELQLLRGDGSSPQHNYICMRMGSEKRRVSTTERWW